MFKVVVHGLISSCVKDRDCILPGFCGFQSGSGIRILVSGYEFLCIAFFLYFRFPFRYQRPNLPKTIILYHPVDAAMKRIAIYCSNNNNYYYY